MAMKNKMGECDRVIRVGIRMGFSKEGMVSECLLCVKYYFKCLTCIS